MDGWQLNLVAEGEKGPRDRAWGDYNTVRPLGPDRLTWLGGSQLLPTCNNKITNCAHPTAFEFGFQSDEP